MAKASRFHKTLREEIIDTLREEIIKGSLKPGQRISEVSISEKFNISRTPVREALWQLESEGFITIIPRKGAVISTISENDIKDFYETRSLLEGYVAAQSIEKFTDNDIKKLNALNKKMESYHKKNDWRNFYKAHNDFHKILIKNCENELLKNMLESVYKRFQRFRLTLTLLNKVEGSIEQHWQIIDSIKNKDKDRLVEAIKENATYGSKILIKDVLAETGDYKDPAE